MNAPRHVVVVGGTGFLGRALCRHLSGQGYRVTALSRKGEPVGPSIQSLAWDPVDAQGAVPIFDGTFAVVNLSGSPVSRRWTPEVRKEILNSRVQATQTIGDAIGLCVEAPKVWLNASAVGYYGNTGSKEVSEASGAGSGFLAEVAVQWEDAVLRAVVPRTRKIRVRIGIVLGNSGGTLPRLLPFVRAFLGGSLGSGHQFVSWIHIFDFVRLCTFALELEDWQGVMNGTAPEPVENSTLMAELRKAAHRPWSPPVPRLVAEVVTRLRGQESTLLFDGQRAVPQIPLGLGFEFRYPTLRRALQNLLKTH